MAGIAQPEIDILGPRVAGMFSANPRALLAGIG